MREEELAELLDDKSTAAFGVRAPKKLLDKISAAYKEVTKGAVRGNPKGPALLYFAARGLLDWQDQHREDLEGRKPGKRSLEG